MESDLARAKTLEDTHSGRSSTIEQDLELENTSSRLGPVAYGAAAGEKNVDPFEVRLDADDPAHPHNWSLAKRWFLTAAASLLLLNATFSSSAPSGMALELMEYFTFSEEIATLTISLFVAGYCVGPLLWGPLSELYGRRPIFLVTFLFYTGFQVGCALSRNTASILIFRFLGGTFAAAPLANSGAVLADIWDPQRRGIAMSLFTLAPFAGPTLGPTVSGFMAVSGVSWRWVFWVMSLFAGACWFLILVAMPETYLPKLLVEKAKRLRKETGDDRYFAPLEVSDITVTKKLQHTLTRPFQVLFYEPMLMAVTLYMSFVYGCLYLLFEAYPIVFTIDHHLNTGISGLMFLPIFLGGCIGVTISIFVFNPRYVRAVAEHAPHPVAPEFRMEMALFGAPMFALSFFWFAWTSYASISFWAPMMAGLFIGWSLVFIFLSLFNYMIDTYLFLAASALAANTVVRSLFGAGFPLFATQMFNTLNPRWAATLIGFIAILLGPIPFVLMKYGKVLRMKSKYAHKAPIKREVSHV